MSIELPIVYTFDEHPRIVPAFVWRKEWIKDYESPWGVLEKFRFANTGEENDLFELFLEPKKKRTKFISRNLRNLVTMEGLSESRLESILGQNIKDHNLATLKSLLNGLPGRYQDYVNKGLRYCPQCIVQGYHSILHQTALFHRCCYHLVPLQSGCPSCKSSIPYEMSYKWSKQAFTCKCGYSFIDEATNSSFYNTWESPVSEIRAPEI